MPKRTLQQHYEDIRMNALKHVLRDTKSKQLIKSFSGGRIKSASIAVRNIRTDDPTERRMLNKLAALGIINVRLNNTYNLTYLGRDLMGRIQ
jgi:hypothetical protein